MKQLLLRLAASLTPLARLYVRYAPWQLGRAWVFEHFRYRAVVEFTARTTAGFRIRGTTRQFIQRYIYWFGVWEPNLTTWISARLSPGDTFVDVGANVGFFSLLASRLVGPEGRVVALEPSPVTHSDLLRNLSLNSARNVRALNIAAGASSGRVHLHTGPSSDSGKASLLRERGSAVQVELAPLNELLTPEESRKVRIVKIDVEGGELGVLQGSGRLLSSNPEAEFVVEVNADTLSAVMELFSDHGYHAYALPNRYDPEYYLGRQFEPQARRLTGSEALEQADLVFSRVDDASI